MPESFAKAVHTAEQCLATALHYEARGESLTGKRAVYDVIQHRMGVEGKSACVVIKQRGQFSWYPKKPMMRYNKEMKELLTEVVEADEVLINERYQYFFKRGHKPRWAYKLACRRIGSQDFCKERKK